ncbi:bacteriocin-like protein [Chryseobacterium sp. BIGb0232]|uniref:bacteriocin-like protein n=1 Tax=unclassified Chryseobacterium TaxID=2593645 RepID=UPI000F4E2273|nr:hypothetical protein [Chryseobacterium sp. BIGb0232]ROS11268.1 hypothetical protein EDF65_3672 [Chryseobacterium nakagawai]
MKNLKKLNRKALEELHGAGPSRCGGCPQNATFGNGPNDYSCATYQALPTYCKMCVIVSSDCMDGGVS